MGLLESSHPWSPGGWDLPADRHPPGPLPGFLPLCARTQPDHGHQECRPALCSDLPAPLASHPFSASSGRRWMDSVIPLAPFLPSMSSQYLWRRQKITSSLSHMRKPFMREVRSGCFVSSWPGRHLRHLSVGQAPVYLRPAVRGSDADCPPEGWHLRTGRRRQGACWSWCRARQL